MSPTGMILCAKCKKLTADNTCKCKVNKRQKSKVASPTMFSPHRDEEDLELRKQLSISLMNLEIENNEPLSGNMTKRSNNLKKKNISSVIVHQLQ